MKGPLLLLSHLAIGLAGWGIAVALRPVVLPEAPTLPTKTDRPVPATREADALIRRIRSDVATRAAAKAKEIPPEQVLREKFLARLSSLPVPSDPAAAFRAALDGAKDEDSELTAAARFVLWAQADPAAALAFAAADREFLERDLPDLALEAAGERLAPEIVLAFVASQEIAKDDLLSGLARMLVSTRSPQELSDLVLEQPDELKSSLKYHLRTQWPANRLDDFGRFVTALDDPGIIPFGSNQWSREDMTVWLVRFVANHPDPDFARRLRESSTFTWLLRDSPDLPLQDRIAGFSNAPDAIGFLADHDVQRFLRSDDGPDLKYEFRHGRIEAPEILKLLSVQFPEYAAAGLLPTRLHTALCAEDPVRAAVLLDHLPERERAMVMTKNFDEQFFNTPLDTVRDALRLLPLSEDEDLADARRELLHSIVDHGLDDYGPEYVEWIATLPTASDRESALGGIARRIEGSYPSKGQEIREIIGDIPLPDTN